MEHRKRIGPGTPVGTDVGSGGRMKTLITGGAGYVGSTVASACIDAGITPVILDDLSTGREEFVADRTFYRGDIADAALIGRIFEDHPDIFATIHCAAKIVVPDSVARPLWYYQENVVKTLRLIELLLERGCQRLVYSSSASIYRATDDFAVGESSELEPTSPYARTKVMVEWILEDSARAYGLGVISLRYFNPIGSDPQLRTGLADPQPTHALGKLIEAASRGRAFTITGTDWPTRDGSGIRDYIHVWDLARAHVRALERFDRVVGGGTIPYRGINLGTGRGTTVRELVAAFQDATGKHLAVTESGPRPGDAIGAYASTDLARELLDWQAEYSISEGIRDTVRWFERRDRVLGMPRG
jgi:UDP-glucose 4-epimerase